MKTCGPKQRAKQFRKCRKLISFSWSTMFVGKTKSSLVCRRVHAPTCKPLTTLPKLNPKSMISKKFYRYIKRRNRITASVIIFDLKPRKSIHLGNSDSFSLHFSQQTCDNRSARTDKLYNILRDLG